MQKHIYDQCFVWYSINLLSNENRPYLFEMSEELGAILPGVRQRILTTEWYLVPGGIVRGDHVSYGIRNDQHRVKSVRGVGLQWK